MAANKEIFLINLGKVVRDYRTRMQISQNELALRIEITQPQLARIEKGDLNTTSFTLYRLIDELNIDTIEIFKINN